MKHFTENIVSFLLVTVLLKVIIAHWVAERLEDYGKKVFSSSERNFAIWLHYQARANGIGHVAESVLHCGEDKCRIFI